MPLFSHILLYSSKSFCEGRPAMSLNPSQRGQWLLKFRKMRLFCNLSYLRSLLVDLYVVLLLISLLLPQYLVDLTDLNGRCLVIGLFVLELFNRRRSHQKVCPDSSSFSSLNDLSLKVASSLHPYWRHACLLGSTFSYFYLFLLVLSLFFPEYLIDLYAPSGCLYLGVGFLSLSLCLYWLFRGNRDSRRGEDVDLYLYHSWLLLFVYFVVLCLTSGLPHVSPPTPKSILSDFSKQIMRSDNWRGDERRGTTLPPSKPSLPVSPKQFMRGDY